MSLALVTGGCGFIGRRLVDQLMRQGDDVRVLDIAEPYERPDGADFRRGSILDSEHLAAAMRGVDHVYHIAGISHFWVRRVQDLDAVNAQGTALVLREAARAGIKRVLHCSTEAILLGPDRAPGAPVDDGVLPPYSLMAGPYTRSKHRAETIALAAASEGLDVVIASPTVPIGDRDYNLTPPAAMLSRFLKGGAPLFLDCTLNLVGVRDVAQGMALAVTRGRPGARYVLGAENVALRDLLVRVEAMTGRKMPTVALPGAAALAIGTASSWVSALTRQAPPATREGVQVALWSGRFECRRARDELGYNPGSVDAALAEALAWLGYPPIAAPHSEPVAA